MHRLTIGNCDISVGPSAAKGLVLLKIWEHSAADSCEQTNTPMSPMKARRLARLLKGYARQVEQQAASENKSP